MDNLIDELKQQHKKLLSSLHRLIIEDLSPEQIKKIMLYIKNLLLEHIEKENTEFYPILYKEAKSNDYIKTLISTFGEDYKKINEKIERYYNKYFSYDLLDKDKFISDTKKIISMLEDRIFNEEAILFPLYYEINDKDKN